MKIRFDILTAVPNFFDSPLNCSIIKKAREKQIVDIYIHDLHNFSPLKHKQIDDYPYGGAGGMVLRIEPIYNAIKTLTSKLDYDEIIYLTPDGEKFNQKMANELSLKQNFIILCGHYKGVDYRIREHLITKEISIGDYVLTGGEPAALVLIDAIVRLIPGVISDESSALTDSFQDNLLEPPIYTRPREFNGWKVPNVLLSGNEKKIFEWNLKMAIKRTKLKRPDLLNK